MKILQPPQIATIETIDGNFVSEHIPGVGECVFDTDRLLLDPRPRFKNLSLGDFDLYAACAYCLISKCWEDDGKIEIEQNRIERTLRIQVISKENGWIPCSYVALDKNRNAFSMERAMNVLNRFFKLIDDDGMGSFQRDAAAKPFSNLLSRGYSHLFYSHSNARIYDDFFYKDVLLVFRKICAEYTFSGSSLRNYTHLEWFRQIFRGYRNYVTFAHPELLE